MLKIAIIGVAMASMWLWLFTLIRKELKTSILKPWLKIIMPTGLIMAWALFLLGVI